MRGRRRRRSRKEEGGKTQALINDPSSSFLFCWRFVFPLRKGRKTHPSFPFSAPSLFFYFSRFFDRDRQDEDPPLPALSVRIQFSPWPSLAKPCSSSPDGKNQFPPLLTPGAEEDFFNSQTEKDRCEGNDGFGSENRRDAGVTSFAYSATIFQINSMETSLCPSTQKCTSKPSSIFFFYPRFFLLLPSRRRKKRMCLPLSFFSGKREYTWDIECLSDNAAPSSAAFFSSGGSK